MWVVVLVTLMFGGVNGELVTVGGNAGWNQGINYTYWVSQQTFYIGEWLLFRFDKNYFDVLEVNQTSYEHCNSENFIANITKGGRDVFQLTEARPYYFITSKGYCWGGMKLAIDVKNLPPPPAPPPQENYAVGQSMYAGSMNVMPVLVLAISVFVILFG
ncbi:lamin-like protein [Chenopodium quinoa]|uniref:lamin-like protein n=1 Tax=Chenopodium quinoa TaxID=63459 RepID=UPI000B77979B|nr:lamin-like protein [Chenopodium quinoa]